MNLLSHAGQQARLLSKQNEEAINAQNLYGLGVSDAI
jgi:hypothetical protein